MLDAFSPQQMSFTLGQVLLSLSLAFALAYLTATVYRKLYAGSSYTFSFYVTLLVSPVAVAMIMMAIGSNVALSLGLVGALSVIRFRTVIKDPRDMTFLFLMIAVGLCCGSAVYSLAIMGTAFVCAVAVALNYSNRWGVTPDEYILIFRRQGRATDETDRTLDSILSWRKLHGVTDLGEDEGCEYTYRVRLDPTVRPETVLGRLKSVAGLIQPALISPESQLTS